ncbi:hypothetical protein B6S44_00635 [Bosea sp. Tri-44]|nr:hypothetical protein B6S44_00635 [Bosea sp. Tri-44]
MVDRDLEHRYPKREPKIGEVIFRIEGWTVFHPQDAGRRVIKGVDFQVRRGEIVGIAGLMGAGRTEFVMSVFGRSYGRQISRTATLEGREVDLSTVRRAIDAGLAYVTEDREELGLILAEDIRKNMALANLAAVAPGGVVDDMAELKVAQGYRTRTGICSASVYQEAGQLSGGNQRRSLLSKWLFTEPKVLILDEPTRGIDIGAKYEICCIINELADSGRGVIGISSEMPELLGICVMNEGAFVGEFAAADASQEKIMRAIMRNGEARHERRYPERRNLERRAGASG